MNLLDQRKSNNDEILKGRFARRVMSGTAKDIDKAQRAYMSGRGFENNDWFSDRSFIATDTSLEYTHLKKHRFVDMRTRTGKDGVKRKKSHAIHNKIIWGHYNEIIKQLHFGFTEAVKNELRSIDNQ